ncbi:MAG TPA: hypothetical protein VFQ52_11680 [Rhizomicrobium sp.]|nr:hypothetical protein [Rhizomicrobium sp.]
MRSDDIRPFLCIPLAFVLLITVMHGQLGFKLRTDAMMRVASSAR